MSNWNPGAKAVRLLGEVGTPLLYAVGAVALGTVSYRLTVGRHRPTAS